MDKFISILFFIFLVALATTISNAMTSIATVLSAVVAIYLYKKHMLAQACIPKAVYLPMLVYILGLFLTTVAVHDKACFSEFGKMLVWMLPFLLFFALSTVIKKNVMEKLCVGALNTALLAASAAAIAEFLQTHKRVESFYGHPNHYATMMDLVLPLCVVISVYYVYKKQSLLGGFLLAANTALGIAGVYFSGSRGGFLGLFLGLLLAVCVYGWQRLGTSKMLKVLCVAFVIFGSALYAAHAEIKAKFSRSYDYERVLLLKSSYAMWDDHKLFGVGLGRWDDAYHTKYILPEAKEPNLNMPHNIFAYYFSTTGIIGGMAFCVLLLGLAVFLTRSLAAGGFTGVCALALLWALFAINIHGMVDVGLQLRFATRLFYGVLGLVAALVGSKECGVKDEPKIS